MHSCEYDGDVVLSLEGKLDFHSHSEVLARLQELSVGGRRVRLDLTRVEEVDMTGLTVLLRAELGFGSRLSIVGASPPVERVLSLVEPALSHVSWPGRRPLAD